MPAKFHPYSSAVPFFQGTAPGGIPELDQNRLRSYELYEEMYWNHPETFRLLQRGEDQEPIYLPTARKIIEAINRYLAVDFDYVVEEVTTNPETGETQGNGGGTEGAKALVDAFFKALFKRENFYSKFNSQKRYSLIRGDAIWHIRGDEDKPEGSRLSIHDVNPEAYFPIHAGELIPGSPVDRERVVGCYLVDTVPDPKDDKKQLARVQKYMKLSEDPNEEEESGISSTLSLFEIGAWDERFLKPTDIKKIGDIVPTFTLDPKITALPVYHWKSTGDTTADYGSSILRGIETVLAAINQAISDEDLALVMAGLGGYWTDAAPPLDPDTQEPTSWELGPLRMTEVPMGRTVGRLAGVGSVAPSQDHIKMLSDAAAEGVGVPEIAIGKVDTAVAESGISLALQLSPLLAGNAEREVAIIGLHDQMFHDIAQMWGPVYEGLDAESVVVSSIVGDPLPKPPKGIASLADVIDLYEAKLITGQEARELMMSELGLNLLTSDFAAVLSEQKEMNADPFAQRVNDELGGNGGEEGALPPANANAEQ